jgi:hypothetical protein
MTDKWVKDTGEVFALALVFFGFIYNFRYIYFLALIVLLITTTAPALLRPLAFVWLKFTQLLAIVMPKVFFGLVFYVIITPIGFVRKILGYDSLNLNDNHKKISSFITRNHLFTKKDLIKPY